MCAWQLVDAPQGGKALQLNYARDIDFARTPALYGMFTSQRQATETLRNLADAHQLCLVQLGLEKPVRGKTTPCFAHQLKKCRGVCVGKENSLQHDLRLMEALTKLKLKTWPFEGVIAIKETYNLKEEVHLIDHWCYLGTAKDEGDIDSIMENASAPTFDLDTYKILVKYLKGSPTLIPQKTRIWKYSE